MNSKPSNCLKTNTSSINRGFPSEVKPLAAAIRAIIASFAVIGPASVYAGELPVPSAALATLGRADQVVN